MKEIQLNSAHLRYEAKRKRRSVVINILCNICVISFMISIITVGQIENSTNAFLIICTVVVLCPITALILALLLDNNESYAEYIERINKKWLM